uniref:trypsin n=1 Tax=Neogobius melanostomus TaxID=47308 RepID=A0A8C6WY96_9GOBI
MFLFVFHHVFFIAFLSLFCHIFVALCCFSNHVLCFVTFLQLFFVAFSSRFRRSFDTFFKLSCVLSSGGGGASLINDRWAVTAAHVVDHDVFEPLWYGGIVHGGSKNPVELQTEKNHYSSRLHQGNSGISSPICLPENNRGLQENELGTVAGFGMTAKNKVARMLKHAPIAVYSEQKCRATPDVKMQYTQNMFCAGADGKDSCEKDGGGPYFVPYLDAESRPFRLMGIVSWGAPCYQREHKGYYTKVEIMCMASLHSHLNRNRNQSPISKEQTIPNESHS